MKETETIVEGVTLERVEQDIRKFGIADAAIAELKARFAPLQIAGVDDLQGFEAVKRARLEVRKYRTKVEEVRKALKADSLEYGRRVDAEAKRITGLILEVEGDLQAKETAIEQERLRIAQEAQRALEARRAQRVEALRVAGIEFDGLSYCSRYCETRLQQSEIDSLEDANFALLVQGAAQAKQEAEAAALAAEQARQAAEAAERARLQAEQEALREQQRALAAERAAMEAERAELARLRAAEAQRAAEAMQQPQEAPEQDEPAPMPWEALQKPHEAPQRVEPAPMPWEAPLQPAPQQEAPAAGRLRLFADCPACGYEVEAKRFNLDSRTGEICCANCGSVSPVAF